MDAEGFGTDSARFWPSMSSAPLAKVTSGLINLGQVTSEYLLVTRPQPGRVASEYLLATRAGYVVVVKVARNPAATPRGC